MKTIRILAVDDHEMTTMGYKFILEDTEFDNFKVLVDTAKSYEQAIEKIENSVNSFAYDILLLDIQLSQATEGPAKTGEDIGIIARKVIPKTKIVFMSSFSDNYRINSILKTVDPEGYMVKTEIDQKSLQAMVQTVMTTPPYYTQKALAAIRKKMANDDIILDEKDKKILHYLSIGTKTKDMVNHVSLSLPSIENRKRHLKAVFGVEKQNDQALITESRNRGFI
ncbi:response regulator [uncultured Eudoraea sp.]|uniref:response regulator n=1 Tax=uncultured Eudoraea sp. TaxID=1035614 RepID=UPI00260390C8|nr:response regulator [uncultured Eudoraea sp.]